MCAVRGHRLSKVIPRLGFFLQLAAVTYVGYLLLNLGPELDGVSITRGTASWIIMGLTITAFGSLLLHWSAWLALLRGARGEAEGAVRSRSVAWVFCRTTIAKYLPSNTLHYVGRQLLAPKAGLTQNTVLASGLGEVALVVMVASFVGLTPLILGLSVVSHSDLKGIALALGGVVGLLGPMALIVLVRRGSARWATLRSLKRIGFRSWWTAGVLYLGFFVMSALGYVWAVALLGGGFQPGQVGITLSAFGLSYAIGYVTPGAPGGLGIREALLVYFLGASVGVSTVLLAALAHRLVTMVVEVGAFVVSTVGPLSRPAELAMRPDHTG